MKTHSPFRAVCRAEWLKVRKNAGVWVLLALPVVIIAGADLYILSQASWGEGSEPFPYNPWQFLLGRYVFPFFALLYPLAVAIACQALYDMENRDRGFRRLFVLPVPKSAWFGVKAGTVVAAIVLSLAVAWGLFLLSGRAFGRLLPAYGFGDYDMFWPVTAFFFRALVGLVAVAFLQYWLALSFRSFVLPLGIAGFGVIFYMLAYRWEWTWLLPYGTLYEANLRFNKGSSAFFDRTVWAALALGAVFLGGFYRSFRRWGRK